MSTLYWLRLEVFLVPTLGLEMDILTEKLQDLKREPIDGRNQTKN
jgi:hypothetical protein